MTFLIYFFCLLIGYLVGTFNPAYLLAKWKGFDIRKRGSGNAGASNALILFGKVRGVLCAFLDIAKAFTVVFVMMKLFPNHALVYPITAVAVTLGHIFPFYMKFKGGKGLACLGGIILCYDWRYFLVILTVELLVALITNYICFVPITASVAFPISYGIMRQDLWGALILLIATVVIITRHIENLSRIRKGTEMHLSYLWNKEKEIKRLEQNTGKSSSDFM